MKTSDHLTQLRKGTVDLAILAILQLKPRYGGEIVQILGSFPGMDAPTGTVYPLLTRLNKQKLVSTTWEESAIGPPRKYYHLTRLGEQTLAELTENWRALSSALNAILKETSQ